MRKMPKKMQKVKKKNNIYIYIYISQSGSKWLQMASKESKWLEMASNNSKWLESLEMATKGLNLQQKNANKMPKKMLPKRNQFKGFKVWLQMACHHLK